MRYTHDIKRCVTLWPAKITHYNLSDMLMVCHASTSVMKDLYQCSRMSSKFNCLRNFTLSFIFFSFANCLNIFLISGIGSLHIEVTGNFAACANKILF